MGSGPTEQVGFVDVQVFAVNQEVVSRLQTIDEDLNFAWNF